MAFLSADYFAGGKVPDRSGNNHAIVAPYGLFKAKDGAIAVAPSNDTTLKDSWMLSALGIYWTTTVSHQCGSMRNRQTLLEIIDATTELESVDYWIEVINKAGCPCGRVMNLQKCSTIHKSVRWTWF